MLKKEKNTNQRISYLMTQFMQQGVKKALTVKPTVVPL